eukprot:TRINITY_DN8380_c0_g1_i1.p1 TRINITY_DN8380_c0_g1~~TRINITY_DN8380_c0_g1_i1.p1  ORF type:complete len:452 (-),score=62.02 TRINITY_DN8380_c0_g1_i1:37-1392(-)
MASSAPSTDGFDSDQRAKKVLLKIYSHFVPTEQTDRAKKLLRRGLRKGEGSDKTSVSFATIKQVLVDSDVTSAEDVKPFLRKINISSSSPSVPLKDFVSTILEAVESQPRPPEPPILDFESLDTASLIDQFCKYYTKLMDYRVDQIEIKLKAETITLEKKLSETMTELESTKSSLEKVKDIAKTRVTQLATEVAELTERLSKEKQLEEEIAAERDEYKRKLEELRKLPTGPVKLIPGSSGEPDSVSPRTSVPIVTLPRAVSNLASTKSPREPLPRTKSVYVKRELGELEQLMAELVSPICPVCKQPVLDNPIQAFGKQYHPEHFCCSRCSLELVPGDTFEETDDFRILCGDCLQKERTPYCNNCRNAIADGHQIFLDDAKNTYCGTCAQAVTDGMVLICKSCKGPIEGDCVNALGAKWHPACFICPTCGLDVTQSDFYDVNGFPYCDLHGH